jgi:PAS domain S-box-containing protein
MDPTYPQFFRHLVDRIPDGLWVTDPSHRIIYANPAMVAMSGIGLDAIIGRHVLEDFPEETLKHFRACYLKAIESRQPCQYDCPVVTPGGRVTWQGGWLVPLLEDGELTGVMCTVQDQTELKQTEVQLREGEARYRGLFESLPVGVVVQRCAEKFEAANDAACRILRLTREELFSRRADDLFWCSIHDDGSPFPSGEYPVAKSFRTGLPYTDVLMGLQHGSEDVWLSINSQPLFREGEGRPYAVLASFIDVTQRKRAELALRASERRFQDIVAASADWVWEVDAQGRYTYVSDSVRAVLGYEPQELLGGTPFDLMPPEEAERVAAEFAEIVAGQATFRDLPHVSRHRDGSLRHIATNGTPFFDAAGKLLGYRGLDRDVTQQVLADQILQESEAKYRVLAENASDCIFWLGTDLRYRYVSPACEHVFGVPGEDILARPELMDQAIHPDDRAAWQAHIGGVPVADGKEVEFRVVRPGGEVGWIAHHCKPIFDEQGVYLGRRGSNRDITARKRAELALADSLRFARQLIDTVPSPLYYKDAEGRYLGCNAALERFLGVREADLLGKTASDLSPKEAARFEAADRALFDHPGEQVFEAELAETDGKPRHLVLHKATFTKSDGTLGGLVGLLVDVTAMRATEAQLRKLSQAVEQSPESIFITDLNGTIEYVNAAFERITGYHRDEAVGSNPRILSSGLTPRETYAALWSALAQGGTWRGEFINRRKEGRVYVEAALISPIHDADGRMTHYLAVKEDITDKKRLEAELERHQHHLEELVEERTRELHEAKAAADAANRTKSAFLANMSHEIRTPMNAIIGFAHLLRQDEAAPRQIERLGKLELAAQHLLSLLNDILDLSKIEAGQLTLEDVDFSLPDVFDQIATLAGDEARRKGLRFDTSIEGVPHWLRGDPTRLRQSLLNYASNAVKFTEHGYIALRAGLTQSDGEWVTARFEVEDSGVGICPDAQSRLFVAFEQADASMTRQFGGTGLGLAITRRLAEQMGGEVGVHSERGRGSRFWFTARLRRGQPKAADPGSAAAPAGWSALEGARVLLVEDNEINREVFLELLRATGLAIDTAEDGAEAVEKVKSGGYDLILMDVQMPVMDGLEATRAIRALPLPQCPIIALTANAFGEDREACLAAGMDDHIAKPVDPGRLNAVLILHLARRSHLNAELTRGAEDRIPGK